MIFGTSASTGFVADAANPISVNPLASTPTPFTWDAEDIYLPATFSTHIQVPGQAAEGERAYIIRYGTQDFGPFSAFAVGHCDTHVPQCSDTRDNDGDGKIDFPADPDCTSPTDNREAPTVDDPCADKTGLMLDGCCDNHPQSPSCPDDQPAAPPAPVAQSADPCADKTGLMHDGCCENHPDAASCN
jgi:hypothetical protein